MPRSATLSENTKKSTTLSSNVAAENVGTGSKHNIVPPPEDKNLHSTISSSMSKGAKIKAPMHRSGVKRTYRGNSSIFHNDDNTDQSKSQNHPLEKDKLNVISSLISNSMTSIKKIRASTNDSSLISTKPLSSLKFPTSVEFPASLSKSKSVIELTHLYEQLNSRRTPNFTRADPSGPTVADTKVVVACDGNSDIVDRIQRIADGVFSDFSGLEATMKEDSSSKTTSESKSNAVPLINTDYPSLTNELVLDAKRDFDLQAKGVSCFPSSNFTTATNITASKAHKNSNTSDKFCFRPKEENNVTDSNNYPSLSSNSTGYISFDFDNPNIKSPASLHVITEKMNVIPCIQPKEIENHYEEYDDDNDSMLSYFEITQSFQEDDYYNYEEDEVEEEEEEKKVKKYETPKKVTPEDAYSDLEDGRLDILETLANIDKIINDLMNSIHNNKNRMITVGFKFEDIAKEEREQEAIISSERTEELKLKKEEYWKRLRTYQKNHNKMNKQAMIQMTKATKNMVALVSVERALVCMKREFIDVKKKKNGIFKKIRNLFGFGRED